MCWSGKYQATICTVSSALGNECVTGVANENEVIKTCVFSPIALQALHVSMISGCNINERPPSATTAQTESSLAALHASASQYPRYSAAWKSSSKHLRVSARVSQHPVDSITIGLSSDVPCIAQQCVCDPTTLLKKSQIVRFL